MSNLPAPRLLTVGTPVRVTLRDGSTYDMVISQRHPAGSAGRAHSAGPHIVAHIRPGGYSVALDSAEVASVDIAPQFPSLAAVLIAGHARIKDGSIIGTASDGVEVALGVAHAPEAAERYLSDFPTPDAW